MIVELVSTRKLSPTTLSTDLLSCYTSKKKNQGIAINLWVCTGGHIALLSFTLGIPRTQMIPVTKRNMGIRGRQGEG